MRGVQRGVLNGFAAGLGVMLALAVTVGLGPAGWLAGIVVAAAGNLLVARARVRHGVDRLGPGDWVTATRALIVVGVTALVADGTAQALLVTLAAVALALDAVDGRVARRTGTTSVFGAAFDMEVDAWLILVLSVQVAPEAGPWVLLIGAARYLLGIAAHVMPMLRRPVPVRWWAKVVAAIQGITLAVVATGWLPLMVGQAVLVVALLLLTESFAHQVRWLTTHAAPSVPETVTQLEGAPS